MRNQFIATVAVFALALAACGGGEPAPAAPAGPPAAAAPASPATPNAPAPSPAANGTDLVGQLKSSKLSLLEGIQRTEKENGPAISAKFELEDGKLMLSVYTAQAGLDKDAEHNVLLELSGDAAAAQWQPKREVFEDREHITRAATHLTILRRAKTTLPAIIAKASSKQAGTVYSVTPVVHNKQPAFDVLVASPEGKSVSLTIEPG